MAETEKYEYPDFQYGQTDQSQLLQDFAEDVEDDLWTLYKKQAGENLEAYKAVYLNSSNQAMLHVADSTNTCIGLTTESATISWDVRVQRIGEIYNGDWTWTPGAPIYVDTTTAGELTEVVDDEHREFIGWASDATSILLAIDQTERDKILDTLKLRLASNAFGYESVVDVSITSQLLTDDTTGVVTNTIKEVSGTGDDQTINDNDASLTDEIIKIKTDLDNLASKVNEVITALENCGVLT